MRYWPTIAARVPTRSLHLSRGLGVEPAPGLRSQVLPAGRRRERHPGRRAAGPGALLCARVQPRTPRAACRELNRARAVDGGPAAAAAQAGAVLARRRRRRALARPTSWRRAPTRVLLCGLCVRSSRGGFLNAPYPAHLPQPPPRPTAPIAACPYRISPMQTIRIWRHVLLNKKRSTAARSAAPRVCSPAAALGWPAGALLRLAAKSAAPPGK